MTLLPRFSLSLILLLCAPLDHAPLAQAQSPSVITNVNLTFTTIDVPGAGYTGVLGINSSGDMVGNYGQDTSSDSHGFLYTNGTFTYFDYPGESVTVPLGINDSGVIVGHAGQNPVVGFLYDGTSFTTLRADNRTATFASGINNAGEVVGAAGTIYATRGFEMRNGHYKAINFPGQYVYGYASGINNLGEIVGFTDYAAYAYKLGRFKLIHYPQATQTEAWGINDGGVIVGSYDVPSDCLCAFAAKKGKYLSFRYPGAVATAAIGINAAGQIVGQYFDGQTFHGFVTSPITAEDFQ